MKKTPEYDRICKLLSQPIHLSSGIRGSSATTDSHQVQQQQQLKHQQQQQFKNHQNHQRQLKIQQKNQQLRQQQHYNVLGRISSSPQQNRSVTTNNNAFGLQNPNRRTNYCVRIYLGDYRYSMSE